MIFAAFIWIPQHLHRGELGLTPRIQITVISSTSRPKIWVPSVHSVHLQAWLLWKWFHFAHWTLIELTSSSFATNIHFDYVFWVRNSAFSMFFMHFQTINLPANITSWTDFGLPGVSLSAIASILAERLFKNFSRGINRRDRRDAWPMGMGSKGWLKTGFVWRRDLKFINQVKDVKMNLWCEQDSRQIYGMSAIWEDYVQFWSNAFAQWRRQSAKVLLSGTHRRITKGESTSPTSLEFSFIGGAILVLTCFFLSAFKNWVICCSRLHVSSHQTLDQTSILGYIPWELGEWGLPFSISIEVPLKTFDDEKWDPFPSRTCQKTKWHLSFAKDDLNHGKYYIHRVHLDFTAAVFLAAVWLWQHFSAREDSSSNTRVFFGFLGIKIKLSLGAWRL